MYDIGNIWQECHRNWCHCLAFGRRVNIKHTKWNRSRFYYLSSQKSDLAGHKNLCESNDPEFAAKANVYRERQALT